MSETNDDQPSQFSVEFVLPRGFTGPDSQIHRNGVLRLATQQDLIAVESERADSNGLALAWSLLLSRILIKLGALALDRMDRYDVVLAMWAGDVAYLQLIYESLDRRVSNQLPPRCPKCGAEVDLFTLLSQRSDQD